VIRFSGRLLLSLWWTFITRSLDFSLQYWKVFSPQEKCTPTRSKPQLISFLIFLARNIPAPDFLDIKTGYLDNHPGSGQQGLEFFHQFDVAVYLILDRGCQPPFFLITFTVLKQGLPVTKTVSSSASVLPTARKKIHHIISVKGSLANVKDVGHARHTFPTQQDCLMTDHRPQAVIDIHGV